MPGLQTDGYLGTQWAVRMPAVPTLFQMRVEVLLNISYDSQMTTNALTANAVTDTLTALRKDKPLKY